MPTTVPGVGTHDCLHRLVGGVGRRSQLRQPEVQDFHEPIGPEHDVFRLHVAVHDARRMRRVQGGGYLDRNGQRRLRRDGRVRRCARSVSPSTSSIAM